MERVCNVVYMGTVRYSQALELQGRIQRARLDGKIDDIILFLSHPPTITFGRRDKTEELKRQVLRNPLEEVRAAGIEIYDADRGGSVTYHDEGQIIGYPIVDIKGRYSDPKDIVPYVKDLYSVLIMTARTYGIDAYSAEISDKFQKKRMGVFADVYGKPKKLASVGVSWVDSLNKRVTKHGFALNVNTNLKNFAMINPCGLDCEATSFEEILGERAETSSIKETVVRAFKEVFGFSSIEEKSQHEILKIISASQEISAE